MATPFTETEINSAIESLIALEPTFSENAEQYTALLKQYAHLSHKQWNVTENCSNELAKLIGDVDATLFQTLFKRVLSGGNWAGAMEAKINRNKNTYCNFTFSILTSLFLFTVRLDKDE